MYAWKSERDYFQRGLWSQHSNAAEFLLLDPNSSATQAIQFGLKERRIFVGSETGEINCINAAARRRRIPPKT